MIREIHLTNELSQLIKLGDFVHLTAEEFGLDEKLCMRLKLALEEAVTNIIQYGYRNEKNKEIQVCLKKESNCLFITIIDEGFPFDPTEKEAPDTTSSAEERPIGGLGIYLIKEIMTEVKYTREEGKNVLMMIKNLR
ncbi:ATP-binding protein [Parabacteroides sp. PF5-9]|uniref:ATP-binding protein n=1 Tax=Parabacteroides sp. PF5-9 TaxID=1742404 RepID=UPI002475882C|nr:ATP-binding protein [Parabacteroides sp. PF5-9]MDH6359105.1 serine/threonine-protein kinase RsbW [Parabacteroides sp. PF5-9]